MGDKNRGLGQANLRKKEKTNGYWGLKTGGGVANLRKEEKTNGLVGAKNKGWGDQPKGKRKNEWISRG